MRLFQQDRRHQVVKPTAQVAQAMVLLGIIIAIDHVALIFNGELVKLENLPRRVLEIVVHNHHIIARGAA